MGSRTSPTVAEWRAEWLRLYANGCNEETTRHKAAMTAGFARKYEARPLRAVTVLQAQRWANKHPGSVRYLRLMFSKARKAGVLDVNVWESVEAECTPTLRRPPSREELEAIVAAAGRRYGEHWQDLIVFTAYTGLRLSEVAGVQAGDVLDQGRRLVVRGKRTAGQVAPRTRTVAVFDPGRAALRRQACDVGRVWSSPAGRPLNRSIVSRCFGTLLRDAGIEDDLTFHCLRHFHASWLLDRGASEMDVAMQLGHVTAAGHANPALVRRVYGHPNADAALARLEAVAG